MQQPIYAAPQTAIPQAAVPQTQSAPFPMPQTQPAPYPVPQAQPAPYPVPQTQPMPYPGPQGPQAPYSTSGHPQAPVSQPLIGLARNLEQTLPYYQIAASVLHQLSESPQPQSSADLQNLQDMLEDVISTQYAALGTIRRTLYGEPNSDLTTSLAVCIHRLIKLHSQLRPLLERTAMGASPERRGILTGLSPTIGAVDGILAQAASTAQASLGPQVWESTRTQVYITNTGTETSTAR